MNSHRDEEEIKQYSAGEGGSRLHLQTAATTSDTHCQSEKEPQPVTMTNHVPQHQANDRQSTKSSQRHRGSGAVQSRRVAEEQHGDHHEEEEVSEEMPGAFAWGHGAGATRLQPGQLTNAPYQANETSDLVTGALPPMHVVSAHAEWDLQQPGDSHLGSRELRNSVPAEQPQTSEADDIEKRAKVLKTRQYAVMLSLLVAIAIGVAIGVSIGGGDDEGTRSPQEIEAAKRNIERDQLISALFNINTDQEAWEDTDSAEYRALDWLLDEEWQVYSEHRLHTRYALAALFWSTGGDERWVQSFGFTLHQAHECTWNKWYEIALEDEITSGTATHSLIASGNPLGRVTHFEAPTCLPTVSVDTEDRIEPRRPNTPVGVVCDDFEYSGTFVAAEEQNDAVVVGLFLADNGLVGTFPESISVLSHLRVLDLSANQLKGKIKTDPSSASILWPQMQYLDMNGNELEGIFDLEKFVHMKELQVLALGDNAFSFTLPESPEFWSQWQSIVHLELYHNNLTGKLPESMGVLSKLTCFDLRFNKLTGTIPANWVQSKELTTAWTGGDDDESTFPSFLADSLSFLGVSENSLTGTLPTLLSTSLARLQGSRNRFSGPLPIPPLSLLAERNMTMLLPLEWIILSGNRHLTGTIPVADMVHLPLKNVHLADNLLSGTIGSEIGDIQKSQLVTFQIHANQLSGSIPSTIGKLTTLQLLWSHLNDLTGTIPTEVGLMQDLRQVYFNENSLTGSVPSQLGNLPKLERLVLSNNQLSGSLEFLCQRSEDDRLEFLTADCLKDVECSCCSICN